MWLNFRLKVRDFFRKYKKRIYIIVVIWLIIIGINKYLGNLKEDALPEISYVPHVPIIEGTTVTKKVQKEVENIVEKYYNYCNTGKYEDAYNLISEECRNYRFGDLDTFKKYIEYIFDGNKIYDIQAYSNKDNVYVYTISIYPDILASGMNERDDDFSYEEKAVLKENNDGTKSFSVDGYIGQEMVNYVGEDDYMKIWIEKKIIKYDKEIFTVRIKNKTDNVIVLANRTEENEVLLMLGTESRNRIVSTYKNDDIFIGANNTKSFEISFQKYMEEPLTATEIVFNNIRILPSFTGLESMWKQELDNAIKLYSLTLTL